MNADLIERGLRLRWVGSPEFEWVDLMDVVKNLPKTSAIYRAVHGQDEAEWGLLEHLMAGVLDNTGWLVWSKTKDASKSGAKPPKPTPRPGVVDDSTKRIGKGSLEVEAMKSWLGGDFIIPAS